jgi:hypothetical protein
LCVLPGCVCTCAAEHEERKGAQEKVRTLSGRLTFLLNKLQTDEEAKVVQREEIKKLEAQLRTLQERNECVLGARVCVCGALLRRPALGLCVCSVFFPHPLFRSGAVAARPPP